MCLTLTFNFSRLPLNLYHQVFLLPSTLPQVSNSFNRILPFIARRAPVTLFIHNYAFRRKKGASPIEFRIVG